MSPKTPTNKSRQKPPFDPRWLQPWGGHVGRDSEIVQIPGGSIVSPCVKGVILASEFPEYKSEFVPYHRTYTYKDPNGTDWRTRRRFASDEDVARHLLGEWDIGLPGAWYPSYMILDIDHRSLQEVEEIRSALGATSDNSILEEGERKDHYNLILKPVYHENPVNITLLQNVMHRFKLRWRIEVYPQKRKPKRLPFGPRQKLVDEAYRHFEKWEQKHKALRGVLPFDLSHVPRHPVVMPLVTPSGEIRLSEFVSAESLFRDGLQYPGTRNQATGLVIDLLWRHNLSKYDAIHEARKWIRAKHNGYSDTVNKGLWNIIDGEIQRWANSIYDRRADTGVYPDRIHLSFQGYITKRDLVKLIKVNRGSWPRIKFWFQVIKFCNPRREWPFINISKKKLAKWGSRDTYLQYIGEWEERGLIKRTKSYLVGAYSKAIEFTGWKLQGPRNAVLYAGRAVDHLEGAYRLTFEPWGFRQLLQSVGVGTKQALRRTNQVFAEGATPASGILDIGEARIDLVKI